MTQELISTKYLTTDYGVEDALDAPPAPAKPEIPLESLAPPRARFPIGLMVLCGFFVFISMFGMYSAINRMTTLYFPKTEEIDVSKLGNDPRSRRMKREIREMEERAAETHTKYLPFMTYNEILKFGLAVGFAISVGLFMVRHPKARRFAITVCCVAVFYHVSAIVITCMSTSEVLGPMGNFFDASAASTEEYQAMSAAEKEQAKQAFSNVMTVGFVVFVGMYLFIKFVFYGSCIFYLNRPALKEMFDNRESKDVDPLPAPQTV